MSDICSVYKNNKLLTGVRTKADLQSIDVYCNHAMNFNYGPNPTNERINYPASNCSFGYGYNSDAYKFQAGPNFINLGQSLNFQKQQQEQSQFRGFPGSQNRYQ
jgi:hypothetical protein